MERLMKRTLARALTTVLSLLACGSPAPSHSGTPIPGVPPTPGVTSGTPAASVTPAASPTGAPTTFSVRLDPFAGGLLSPVAATHAGNGDGLLYVVEQNGRIVTVGPDGAVGAADFLDIRDRVVAGGEQGLLGLAFHPQYEENGRFFVMYTAVPEGANTISEFQAAGGLGDPASERVLLAIDDFAGNHNGGMVAFGPDGFLYAGSGDGGGGGDPRGNGQNEQALLGKLLRLDVDSPPPGDLPYAIPADNPQMTGADWAPEIWAIGLRNPWRFSFDRQTGDLWIGDVGQGEWEEVDATPSGAAGLNYGWSIVEGPACFDASDCDRNGLTHPVYAYDHGVGCTIIGGYVYRGEAAPFATGSYLFGDYCSGLVWTIDAAAALSGASVEAREVLASDITLGAFGEDEGGELYALDLQGALLRVVFEEAS